jgi:polyisoprenoid-binding protein YceI
MTTSTLEQLVPAGTWHVDPTHSQIDFSVRHLGISTVRGTFSGVTATLEGGDAPTLTGSIDLATVSTRDEQRDAHLASPDFFDVDRYPEATFTATFIAPDRVVGELTLKGVTREIELAATYTQPADDPYGNERVGIDLEGEINRSDFGVSFNFPLPTGGLALAETVKLLASLSFVKKA